MRMIASLFMGLMALTLSTAANAAQPHEWGLRFQESVTPLMDGIVWFEWFTLIIITVITIFVLALLVIVGLKFHHKKNPNPSKTTHHVGLEVAWTVIPVFILILIAVPSFQLLKTDFNPPSEPELTIKATGYQWYWGYEYQEGDDPVSFDSLMLADGDREAAGKTDLKEYPRLLAVDNEIVVPVDTVVRVLVTAGDVIHAFAMPAMGLKTDAIPGRLNETWFKADTTGLYYGQCSELCGKDHAFMPIAIRVVERSDYDAWLIAARDNVGEANRVLTAAIEAKKNTKLAAAE